MRTRRLGNLVGVRSSSTPFLHCACGRGAELLCPRSAEPRLVELFGCEVPCAAGAAAQEHATVQAREGGWAGLGHALRAEGLPRGVTEQLVRPRGRMRAGFGGGNRLVVLSAHGQRVWQVVLVSVCRMAAVR